jgi:hypothetical protein
MGGMRPQPGPGGQPPQQPMGPGGQPPSQQHMPAQMSAMQRHGSGGMPGQPSDIQQRLMQVRKTSID